jgi:hypothetical protein
MPRLLWDRIRAEPIAARVCRGPHCFRALCGKSGRRGTQTHRAPHFSRSLPEKWESSTHPRAAKRRKNAAHGASRG